MLAKIQFMAVLFDSAMLGIYYMQQLNLFQTVLKIPNFT